MASQAENSFADLRSKYGDFFVPSAKITVDGKDVAEDLKCRIHSVRARLCLGRPSGFRFELVDCYEVEKHAMKPGLVSSLLPGSKVKLSLGYGSSLDLLFEGYVGLLEAELTDQESYSLIVTVADVCRMMQENGIRRRILQVEKHSEAFTKVLGEYSGFCSAQAEDTPLVLSQGLFQEESDYELVAERLVRENGYGYEFLVEKGKALFRKRDTARSPVIQLSPGQGIRRLKLGGAYVNRTLEIQGYSMEQGFLKASEAASSALLEGKAKKGMEIVKAPWATDKDGVTALASSYQKYLEDGSRRGRMETVGLPVLLPGNYVAIKNLDPKLDGSYYMTAVEHILDEEGYRTTSYFHEDGWEGGEP